MPLRRLAALERKKIEDEHKEVAALIKQLEALLRSPKKMREVVNAELQEVKETYGDRRRTHIVQLNEGETKASLLTKAELVAENEIWVTVSPDGLISRSSDDKLPRLSGKEAPGWLAKVSSRDVLYLANVQGEAAAIPVHALPESDDPLQGLPFWKASPLSEGVDLAGLFALPSRSARGERDPIWENHFILTATHQGLVKKSALSDLPGASANSFTLVKINLGDRLGWLQITNGEHEVLLVSQSGMAIRFNEEQVRPMGLVAAGVMSLKLAQTDLLAGMEILPKPGEILLLSTHGKAKRLASDQFPRQGRYGQGVSAWKLAGDEKIVGLAIGKGAAQAIIHTDKLLPKSIRFDEAPLQGRPARGQTIYELKPGNLVRRLTLPAGMVIPDQSAPTPRKSRRPKAVVATQPSLFDAGITASQAATAKKVSGAKKASPRKPSASAKQASSPKLAAKAKKASSPKPADSGKKPPHARKPPRPGGRRQHPKPPAQSQQPRNRKPPPAGNQPLPKSPRSNCLLASQPTSRPPHASANSRQPPNRR